MPRDDVYFTPAITMSDDDVYLHMRARYAADDDAPYAAMLRLMPDMSAPRRDVIYYAHDAHA